MCRLKHAAWSLPASKTRDTRAGIAAPLIHAYRGFVLTQTKPCSHFFNFYFPFYIYKKKSHLPGFVQYLILTVMLLTKLYIV